MKQYSEEFKVAMIAKMLPPHNVSVPELASQTGIPKRKDKGHILNLKYYDGIINERKRAKG